MMNEREAQLAQQLLQISTELAGSRSAMARRAGERTAAIIGDLLYERPLAESLLAWLGPLTAEVLMGDPGRTYFPKAGIEKLGTYNVQTTRDLEDREIRETSVYRLNRA